MRYPEGRWLRLLESQFIFLIVCSREGRIEYISPEGADFFNIITEKVVEGQIQEAISKETAGLLWEIASHSLDSGEIIIKELLLPFSGEDKWFEVTASPVSAERTLGSDLVIISGRDITECRIAEEKLEESEIRINKLLGGSPVPIFVINTNHEVVYWNQAIGDYTGVNSVDIVGTNLHCSTLYGYKRPCMADLLLMENPLPLIEKWYKDRYRKSDLIEGAYEAEDFFPGIGDKGKWLHFTASVVRDHRGIVIGAIETLEDITGQKEAEKILVESKNKYQGYIENSPNAFFIVDSGGNYLEVNPAACDLLGYSNDEFLTMHISQTVPFEDTDKAVQRFERFIRTSEFNEEIRLLKKNGEICNVILKGAVLPDGNYMGFVTDITELKKTSQALFDKEKIFRLLFETMSEGVAIHDLVYSDGKPVDYVITDVNAAFESIIGIKSKKAVGSLASELYGSDSPPYFDIYKKVALSGTPEHFEVFYDPMDKYFEISVVSPKKGSFATIFSDITERKKSETILKESEEKFREVFNNANDIIILIEISNGRLEKIIALNSQGIRVLGYEEDEFLKMDPLLLVDESDRQKVIELAKKSNVIPEISFDILLKAKDGRKIPVEVKSRLFNLGGKQLSLSVLRDITERKIAMDIEKKAFFQIEDNIRQLATLGDSIRNPLTVIVGLADLHGGELGDKIKKEAAEIDDYITMLDRGWIESEKVRDFLKRHYGIK